MEKTIPLQKLNFESQENLKEILKVFIKKTFFPAAEMNNSFQDNDSFMEKGIIDSTGVLELLQFIEERFEITVEDDEVIPENLDSLDNLTVFIENKSK